MLGESSVSTSSSPISCSCRAIKNDFNVMFISKKNGRAYYAWRVNNFRVAWRYLSYQ